MHSNPGQLAHAHERPCTRTKTQRRPLRFWQPFNDWWRLEYERLNRRPTADEILYWYNHCAAQAWGEAMPTLQETRVHAKCLRSVSSVRDYFREYRAKKKTGDISDAGMTAADSADTSITGHRRQMKITVPKSEPHSQSYDTESDSDNSNSMQQPSHSQRKQHASSQAGRRRQHARPDMQLQLQGHQLSGLSSAAIKQEPSEQMAEILKQQHGQVSLVSLMASSTHMYGGDGLPVPMPNQLSNASWQQVRSGQEKHMSPGQKAKPRGQAAQQQQQQQQQVQEQDQQMHELSQQQQEQQLPAAYDQQIQGHPMDSAPGAAYSQDANMLSQVYMSLAAPEHNNPACAISQQQIPLPQADACMQPAHPAAIPDCGPQGLTQHQGCSTSSQGYSTEHMLLVQMLQQQAQQQAQQAQQQAQQQATMPHGSASAAGSDSGSTTAQQQQQQQLMAPPADPSGLARHIPEAAAPTMQQSHGVVPAASATGHATAGTAGQQPSSQQQYYQLLLQMHQQQQQQHMQQEQQQHQHQHQQQHQPSQAEQQQAARLSGLLDAGMWDADPCWQAACGLQQDLTQDLFSSASCIDTLLAEAAADDMLLPSLLPMAGSGAEWKRRRSSSRTSQSLIAQLEAAKRGRLTSPYADLPLRASDLGLLGSVRQGPLGGPNQALSPLWPTAAEAASWQEGQALLSKQLQAAGAPAMAGLAGVQQAARAGSGLAMAALPPRAPAPASAAASTQGGAHMMDMLPSQQQQLWMQQQQELWMQQPGAEQQQPGAEQQQPGAEQQQAAPSAAKGFSLVPDLRTIQRSIAEL